MSNNTSVVLGKHFENFIAEKIDSGEYQSVSEAIRLGLRKLEEEDLRIKAFRAMLKKGLDSPLAEDWDEEQFFSRLYET